MFSQFTLYSLFFFFCVLPFHLNYSNALLARVPSGKTECIQIIASKSDNTTVSFSAFPEHATHFSAWIVDEAKEALVYTLNTGTVGKYQLPPNPDIDNYSYELCFKNENNFVLSVEFFIRNPLNVKESFATEDKTRRLIQRVQDVDTSLAELSDQLSYMLINESLHRETAKQTNHRVVWWIVFKVVCIILLVVVQNYCLRSFFEIKLTI